MEIAICQGCKHSEKVTGSRHRKLIGRPCYIAAFKHTKWIKIPKEKHRKKKIDAKQTKLTALATFGRKSNDAKPQVSISWLYFS